MKARSFRAALAAGVVMGALCMPHTSKADPDNYADVTRGRALTGAGDCVVCHTAPGGSPFAG